MENMSNDREKASSDANRSHDEGEVDIPEDPDAHLSPAEKAEVVGSAVNPFLRLEADIAL